MKKWIALMLALVMCLTLAACGSNNDNNNATDNNNTSGDDQNTAGQEDTPQPSGEKQKLIVGFDAEFPPFGYIAEDGSYCIWNGFTYTGREEEYTWSDPYVENKIVLVVKADSGITSMADLAGKSVMAQAASSAVDAIEANEEFKSSLKEVVELGDYNMGFMELAQGSVDAVAADMGVAAYQVASNEGDYVILDDAISTEQYAIGFLKGNTELRDAVNAELLKMAEDGTMMSIGENYVDKGLVLESLCLCK